MINIRVNQCLSTLATALALMATPAAWAYDSAVNVGIGQATFDYQERDTLNQAQGLKGNSTGWNLGYIGRFNQYLGFDMRWGGAGKMSAAGLAMQPGLFLSLLFRPSLPVSETADLYGLIGITSLAVGRTAVNGSEEIIARVGNSIGAGVNFHFNEHMTIGAEWISYQSNVDFGPSNKSGITNWTGVTQAKVSLSSIAASFKYQF